MAKLSKAAAKAHAQAIELLKKDVLSEDDKHFVLENWNESANHINSTAGAFFTPHMLARDFSIECYGNKIIDLCAGIGGLSFWLANNNRWEAAPKIICVEINPDYIVVGKKIVPQATWIQADCLSLPSGLGRFDFAISNPPFGAIKREHNSPRWSGREFEYHIIDVASDVADAGAFIIPQQSAGFAYSGKQNYERNENERYKKFVADTGISLKPNCGIDCNSYKDGWNGVAPTVEVVTADFVEARQLRRPDQLSLDVAQVNAV